MPIPLGVLAVAGAGGGAAAANAYEWLETTTLGTAAASVTFSNVNTNYGSTYQHLQIRYTARSSRESADPMIIKLSGNTQTRNHHLYGNGSSVGSGDGGTSYAILFAMAASNSSASIFGAGIIDILDPFETSKNTTLRSLSGIAGNTERVLSMDSSLHGLGAVTSIYLQPFSATNFAIGSRFSLYGLRSA